jgi:predicted DCC family thiol-disulfide oxidoreductase YuxK
MRVWTRFWFTPAPASTLGFCRALFFLGLCLWQIPLDYAPWGEYSSALWMPIPLFEWLRIPLLPSAALDAVQILLKISLVFGAIGLLTRPATLVAFVLGTYLMGLPHNFGQTQHFDALIVFVLGALAISRAGDAWSIDALVAAARRGSAERPPDSAEYGWPIRFVWVAMALIFWAAGLSKLRHSGLEWIFSDNLALLLRRQQYHISDGEPLTSWGITVARHPWMAQTMAGMSVLVETMFPLALFSRTARLLLVPAALSFLIGIRVLMGPTFEQFMICFVFWIPWHQVAAAVRSRVPQRQPGRVVLHDRSCRLCAQSVAVFTRLDLLQRLQFANVAAESDWPERYPGLDRDTCATELHVLTPRGQLLRGFDAYRSLAWVLPLGWVMLPVLYLPGVPALGRRIYRLASHRPINPYPLRGTPTPAVSRPPS